MSRLLAPASPVVNLTIDTVIAALCVVICAYKTGLDQVFWGIAAALSAGAVVLQIFALHLKRNERSR